MPVPPKREGDMAELILILAAVKQVLAIVAALMVIRKNWR